MRDGLPTREQALRFLRQSGCTKNVIIHCEAVADLAMKLAECCASVGLSVDLKLVEIGALLHDIGRSQTHSVHHAIAGSNIGRTLGLPNPVLSIIKRHVGKGISTREARRLGWPRDVYVPLTLEEKIVSYADKLTGKSRRVLIEKAMKDFSHELPPPAVKRVRRLAEEMTDLIGDCE